MINPHDKLFRKTYSDLDNARSFLTNYLPEQVLKLVDLATLEISKDSFMAAISGNDDPVSGIGAG